MRSFQFTLIIAGFIIALTQISTTCCLAEDPQMPSISVSGTAEIRVVPDEAVLTFSIESRESELDATVKDNDEKIKAVSEFLTASKVESKHIRTDVITIRPIFEKPERIGWKPQRAQTVQSNLPMPRPANADKKDKLKIKPIGYTARRQLSITITDLESFEAIYRGLIEKGVNDVGGIQFRTTELRKHRDAARLKAVRAAREKADAMAKELGAKLAAVQTITEGSQSRYPSLSNFTQNSISAAPMVGGGSSVAAGMIEITATVQVVFKLGETEL